MSATVPSRLPAQVAASRVRAAVESPNVHVDVDAGGEVRLFLPDDEAGGAYQRVIKAAIDRVGAAVLLFLALPVLAVVALAVRIDLGRGIIYRQQRVGLHGELFDVLKFRTMHPDRRRRPRPFPGQDRRRTHKTNRDPRHTRVGLFLRRTSLDELPQLINVLRGEMSLVGPRPELPEIVERHYEPWHHRRHDVRPGLTGLWQVTERDDEGLMHEHVALDVMYVASVSFLLDVMLMLLTIPALLGYRLQGLSERLIPASTDASQDISRSSPAA